jgi:hypothetical protein
MSSRPYRELVSLSAIYQRNRLGPSNTLFSNLANNVEETGSVLSPRVADLVEVELAGLESPAQSQPSFARGGRKHKCDAGAYDIPRAGNQL